MKRPSVLAQRPYSTQLASQTAPGFSASVSIAPIRGSVRTMPAVTGPAVIAKGLTATQMPTFGEAFSREEIAALAAYVMSRDGWVQKYDIWSLQEVGRVRVGLNSRNIAMSHDGKWLAVANYVPNTLSILSTADLGVVMNLDVGREIAELPLPGMPHLGSGIT